MNNTNHTPKRKPGRPTLAVQAVKKSVSLPPAVHEHLLTVGEGNLSGGIKIAAEFHRSYSKSKTQGNT